MRKRRRRAARFSCLALLFSCLLTLLALLAGCEDPGGTSGTLPVRRPDFELTFLSTGKSDCILLRTAGGVLINDLADEDDAVEISAALCGRAVTAVDYLILSHFDKDHIGAAYQILSQYPVKNVLLPDYDTDSELYRSLCRALEAEKCNVLRVTENTTFSLGDTAVTVYAPHETDYDDENNFSLVTQLTYGEVSLLLMGDALKARTEEILDDLPTGLSWSLVKLPHHGDSNARLKSLLKALAPAYAVLTVDAARNEVDKELPQFLTSIGATAVYTDEGEAVFTSDGKTLTRLPSASPGTK